MENLAGDAKGKGTSGPNREPRVPMRLEERSHLVLAFARVLYVNGQATDQTVAAAQGLGLRLGLCAKIMLRLGELQLQSEDKEVRLIS